jgi:hypothetical protein
LFLVLLCCFIYKSFKDRFFFASRNFQRESDCKDKDFISNHQIFGDFFFEIIFDIVCFSNAAAKVRLFSESASVSPNFFIEKLSAASRIIDFQEDRKSGVLAPPFPPLIPYYI